MDSSATPQLTITSPISEVMRRDLVTCSEHSASHIVVVDSEDRPVGILSTLDVAGVVAG